jgi:hypothetical protein
MTFPPAESAVARAAHQLFEALMRGEYIFLLGPRQLVRSSLLAGTIARLKAENLITIKLDLQQIGTSLSTEQWYAALLDGIGQGLNLTNELLEYWASNQVIGPLARWIGALEEVALAKSDRPIVIFIDGLDVVRDLSFSADEFFAAIRDCYNRRSAKPALIRLTFCLVGVAHTGQLIRNPNITPFNIGSRIDLPAEMPGFAVVVDPHSLDGSA